MHPVTSGFPSFFLVSAPPHPSLSLANRPGLLSFYSQHETALGLEALSSFPASRNVLLVFLRGKANSRSGSWPPHLAPKCHGRKSRERQERRAANPQVSDSLGNANKNTLRERSTRFWFTLTTFPPKGLTRSFTFWAQRREEEESRGQDPLAKAMQRRGRSPRGAPPAQGLSPSMEALGSPLGILLCPPGLAPRSCSSPQPCPPGPLHPSAGLQQEADGFAARRITRIRGSKFFCCYCCLPPSPP